MSNRRALVVFVRHPVLGKVKTRLAAGIGQHAALAFYEESLAHTREVLLSISADLHVFYSDEVAHGDIWTGARFFRHRQLGADLGERMADAFAQMERLGYERIVLIGSDLPQLQPDHLEKAFEALEEHELVFGPATDGGYWLIGCCEARIQLFENKRWSTGSVLADSLADCERNSWTYHLLEELNDIDTAEDLREFRRNQLNNERKNS